MLDTIEHEEGLKELVFDSRNFLYKIREFSCGDYGIFTGYETIFYHAKPIIEFKKKYLFFGEMVERKSYKEAFTLSLNIEDNGYSKDEIKERLVKEVGLLSREEEIKNGDII